MSLFSTQSTSRARVKDDAFNDDTLRTLYNMFESADIDTFKQFAIETVQRGNGKQSKKDLIINEITRTSNKATALKKAQDYILAGQGLGV